MSTKDHGPVPLPGTAPALYAPPVEGEAEPVLMRQQAAYAEADRRNAAGETDRGCVAEAQPYPPDAWDGDEEGWRVVEVAAEGGADPVRARRNTTPLHDPKNWSGKDTEYALMAGMGEPVRTWEDMRLALSSQLHRYLQRFPDPAGAVDDALAYRVASLIVGDHYQHPGTVLIARGHLLAYVAVVRKRLAGEK